MHKDSAEEKLLKLIKGAGVKSGHKRIDDADALRLNAPKRSEHHLTAAAKNRSIPEIGLDKIRRLNLESLNKFLRLVIGLVCLAFIVSFFNSKNIKNILNEGTASEEKSDINVLPKPLSADFKGYSASAGRDVFGASTAQPAGAKSLGSGEITSNLKLLGIISGAKPQAIIEDATEQRTYTVGVGDYFKEFVVEEIGSGKVSFSYKNLRFDLFL